MDDAHTDGGDVLTWTTARLAVPYGGKVFACRHCHRLAYTCQREADYDRVTRRADTLRDRLGWKPGILNGEGLKPKGCTSGRSIDCGWSVYDTSNKRLMRAKS